MDDKHVQIEKEYKHWLTTAENGKTIGLAYKRAQRTHPNFHTLLRLNVGSSRARSITKEGFTPDPEFKNEFLIKNSLINKGDGTHF